MSTMYSLLSLSSTVEHFNRYDRPISKVTRDSKTHFLKIMCNFLNLEIKLIIYSKINICRKYKLVRLFIIFILTNSLLEKNFNNWHNSINKY